MHRDRLGDLGIGQFKKRLFVQHARVVDQCIDRVAGLVDVVDSGIDRRRVGQIKMDGRDIQAKASQRPSRGVTGVGVTRSE